MTQHVIEWQLANDLPTNMRRNPALPHIWWDVRLRHWLYFTLPEWGVYESANACQCREYCVEQQRRWRPV